MCTLSWTRLPGSGYAILFSRDEQRSRATAEPPESHAADACQWIAPRDPDAGGTWIWVNTFGVCACVLNFYDSGKEPRKQASHDASHLSRGLLLRDLAVCRDLNELEAGLSAGLSAARLKPFHLAAFAPGAHAELWTWRGEGTQLERARPQCPVTTSSFRPESVIPARVSRFKQIVAEPANPDLDELLAFHRSTDASDAAHAVCMDRDDARTVSLTQVRVTQDRVFMTYAARSAQNGHGFDKPMSEVEVCR